MDTVGYCLSTHRHLCDSFQRFGAWNCKRRCCQCSNGNSIGQPVGRRGDRSSGRPRVCNPALAVTMPRPSASWPRHGACHPANSAAAQLGAAVNSTVAFGGASIPPSLWIAECHAAIRPVFLSIGESCDQVCIRHTSLSVSELSLSPAFVVMESLHGRSVNAATDLIVIPAKRVSWQVLHWLTRASSF